MLYRRLLIPILATIWVSLLAGCPDKKPKYPACATDKDCKDGQHCVAKKCVQCGEDAHCPEGQTCEAGACVAKEGACTSDDQCSDGQVCKDGVCSACAENAECGPGGKCQSGVCQRPKACTVDEDCEDDEDCIDGLCLQPWKSDDSGGISCELATVRFDFDQSLIQETQRPLLNQSAECILSVPADRGVYIYGHTDSSGTEEYNIGLSERRARAVADYLARLGIDPARFSIVAKGENEPSGQGAEADRRVELQWQ